MRLALIEREIVPRQWSLGAAIHLMGCRKHAPRALSSLRARALPRANHGQEPQFEAATTGVKGKAYMAAIYPRHWGRPHGLLFFPFICGLLFEMIVKKFMHTHRVLFIWWVNAFSFFFLCFSHWFTRDIIRMFQCNASLGDVLYLKIRTLLGTSS